MKLRELPIDLGAYARNGYKYNYVCFMEDGRGDLEYEVFKTKSQAEKYSEYNGVPYYVMTFRQASSSRPELFKL